MWLRKIEEEIEVVRKKMEESANLLGLGHPEVYQISLVLDELHNLWEKEHQKQKAEKIYHIRVHSPRIKETAYCSLYKVVV